MLPLDDHAELLTRLGPLPTDVPAILFDLGWFGDRFDAAVKRIRQLGIRVKRLAGEKICISLESWPRAQQLATDYFAQGNGFDS